MTPAAAAAPGTGTAATPLNAAPPTATAVPLTPSTAAPAAPACSEACWKVDGIGRSRICDGGLMIRNARPTTWFLGPHRRPDHPGDSANHRSRCGDPP